MVVASAARRIREHARDQGPPLMIDEIAPWLASQREAMLGLLEKVVNIDSGSYDKAGVDAVGEAFETFFRAHDIEVERLPREASGDIFRARMPGQGNAPIVLMGHRDTVFSKGEAARRPFTIRLIDDRKLRQAENVP